MVPNSSALKLTFSFGGYSRLRDANPQRDTRNPNQPAYKHASTHADDITHLSLLPPTQSWQASAPGHKLPSRLLLSASTDGCVALSDLRETDEDEALQCAENWNQSVAAAGAYEHKGRMGIWARSDMDNMAMWGVGISDDSEGELEFNNLQEVQSAQFKFKDFNTPQQGPSVVNPVGTEKPYPAQLKTEYLIDVCPSLGVGKSFAPMVGVGTNE